MKKRKALHLRNSFSLGQSRRVRWASHLVTMTSRAGISPMLQMKQLRLRKGNRLAKVARVMSRGAKVQANTPLILEHSQPSARPLLSTMGPTSQYPGWISKTEVSCRKSGRQAANMTQRAERETVHLTTVPWADISHLIFTTVVSPQGFQIS